MATYVRTVRDGPLEGQPVESRYHKGFLLVDKPTGICWLYGSVDDTPDAWKVKIDENTGTEARVWDSEHSWLTAEGNDYDVIAFGAGEQE